MLRTVACSYEGSLFGWDVPLSSESDAGSKTCELKFGFNVTVSSLKTVAVSSSGRFLATGGSNERISLFNVADNKGIGDVSGHSGSVTSLKFFEDSMLLSASEDGTLYIWRVHDWEHLHILGGHKDIVYDFAIHPSGKLALSVSKDHTLKLWNLIQGRCAFTRRLRIPAELVKFHPQGEVYLLSAARELQIFNTNDNSLVGSFTSSHRINSVDFIRLPTPSSNKNQPKGQPAAASSAEYGVVYSDDNFTITVLSMQGAVLKSLDLSSAAVGRLRAISVSYTSAQQRSLISVVTSTGHMFVLDYALLPAQSHTNTSTSTSTGGGRSAGAAGRLAALLGTGLLTVCAVSAEPRLTAVTSWISQSSANHVAVEDAVDEEELQTQEEGGKKNKKKRKQAAISSVDEQQDTGKRVSFQDVEADKSANGKRKTKK
eukprot:gene30538-36907_t